MGNNWVAVSSSSVESLKPLIESLWTASAQSGGFRGDPAPALLLYEEEQWLTTHTDSEGKV